MKYMCSVLFAFALTTGCATPAYAQMHASNPMDVQQFSGAQAGQPVQLVVRIDNINRSAIHAEILERKSEGVYKATRKHVTLYFADGTPVVMGGAADLKPGAVVFVYGVATKKDNADVKQVVVMTRYAQVR